MQSGCAISISIQPREVKKPKGHSTHDGSGEMVILKPDDISPYWKRPQQKKTECFSWPLF